MVVRDSRKTKIKCRFCRCPSCRWAGVGLTRRHPGVAGRPNCPARRAVAPLTDSCTTAEVPGQGWLGYRDSYGQDIATPMVRILQQLWSGYRNSYGQDIATAMVRISRQLWPGYRDSYSQDIATAMVKISRQLWSGYCEAMVRILRQLCIYGQDIAITFNLFKSESSVRKLSFH